jgi:hypothetical protein
MSVGQPPILHTIADPRYDTVYDCSPDVLVGKEEICRYARAKGPEQLEKWFARYELPIMIRDGFWYSMRSWIDAWWAAHSPGYDSD